MTEMPKLPELPEPAENDPRDFDTLGSLPGGHANYLDVIQHVLRDLNSRAQPTASDAIRALAADLELAPRSLEDYLQLLQRMGLLAHKTNGLVILTPLAHSLLKAATFEEQARLIAEYLLQHCTGMTDVLVLYNAATRPLTLRGVASALATVYPRWNDPTVYKTRNF